MLGDSDNCWKNKDAPGSYEPGALFFTDKPEVQRPFVIKGNAFRQPEFLPAGNLHDFSKYALK